MKNTPKVEDNVKVVFNDDNGNQVTLIGKILKIGKESLSLKFFKKVVYNLRKKVNITVDFTPTVKKVKIKNKMNLFILKRKPNLAIEGWDDGGY